MKLTEQTARKRLSRGESVYANVTLEQGASPQRLRVMRIVRHRDGLLSLRDPAGVYQFRYIGAQWVDFDNGSPSARNV